MNTNLKLLAQNPTEIGKIGEGSGFGPFNFGNVNTGEGSLAAISKTVSTVIGFITILAGLFFMIQLLVGGFEWMTASGDKSRLQKAQDRITHSMIGLLVVIAAYAIVSIISIAFGLDILLTNPTVLLNALKLGVGAP